MYEIAVGSLNVGLVMLSNVDIIASMSSLVAKRDDLSLSVEDITP